VGTFRFQSPLFSKWDDFRFAALCLHNELEKEIQMGKGILLWLMGVPLSVIVLIALFTSWI